MPKTEQPWAAFQFGVFELDPRTRELRKRGIKLKVQDQPLQILMLLLERPGDVVTREEIKRRLWADDTFVDFDNAINSAVRKLRDALGDSSASPCFIETLARRGYRFLAPVNRASVSEQSQVASTTLEDRREPGHSRKLWRLIVSAAFAAVALGIAALWMDRNDVADLPSAPVPLTSYPGFQLFPSFSPEGTRVAFSWGEPDKKPSNIYVKMIGPGEPIRLTNNPNGDYSPAWSPDGGLIAFLRKIDREHTAVIVTPAMGGPERELARLDFASDLEIFLPEWEWRVPPPLLAWSADGKSLLAIDHARVVRISVESGEKQYVTSPPATIFSDGSLAVSPDGKTLAFVRTVTYAVTDIYIVPLSADLPVTGESQRITSDAKEITGLAWTADGQALVFPSTRSGKLELWRTRPESGSKPTKFPVTGDDPFDPSISRQKHRLAYAHKFGYENIWRLSLQGNQAGEALNLVPSTREEGHPRYSPDGKRVAFEASFSGHEEIWVTNADGSHPFQLTSFGAWAGSPRWSSDGRRIAFDCNAAGHWDIYVVDSQGGKPIRLTTSPALDMRPSWSHDNQWIYFLSNRTGSEEIWKIPANGGKEIQLTNGGGGVPFESEDGQTLYYGGRRGLWGMSLGGGRVFKLQAAIYKDTFSPAKSGVYFIDPNDAHVKLFEFKSQTTTSLAPVPGPIGDEMSISPDERWLLYERYNYAGSELMLVEKLR